jgi:carbonic anhydrase
MDFRLEDAIESYLSDHDLIGDVDIVAGAGAAKDISQKTDSYLESQVLLSHQLHDTNTVILMNHTDCGGYGGRESFNGDKQAEREQHIKDMRQAKKKLVAKDDNLTVLMVLANIKDDGSVEIEEIG